MSNIRLQDLSPQRALLVIRIVWAALLAGPLALLMIVALVVLPQTAQTPHTGSDVPAPPLHLVCFIMLLTAVPVGFVIQRMIFKRSSADETPSPRARFTGNVIFWACCESVALLGIVSAMLTHSLWPTIIPAAVAMGLQALTFPLAGQNDLSTERPMQ